MSAWTYILRLKSDQLYIGATTDLRQRYKDHCSGNACRTIRADPPLALLYSEEYEKNVDNNKMVGYSTIKTMRFKKYNKYESLPYITREAARSLARIMNVRFKEADIDISAEQWTILINLWEKDGISQQELSVLASKDKTSTTRLIDALEKKNIVVRTSDNNDRRKKLIYLTENGRNLKEDVIPIVLKLLDKIHSGITDREIETAKRVIRKIIKNTTF